MKIQTGYGYHINDSFFDEVQDKYLMGNKENRHYRPHFLAIADAKNPNIYWMIPISSRYHKYQTIVEQQIQRYGSCSKIILGTYAGQPAAFLLQNAFPCIAFYFDHIHTKDSIPVVLHKDFVRLLSSRLKKNLALHRHGNCLFFTDIDRIYPLMERKLQFTRPTADAQSAQ